MLLAARTLRVSVATAAVALAVTIGSTACGSDDKSDAKATTSASAVTSSAAASSTAGHGDHAAAAPTAETLQAVLDGLADPTKSTTDKTKLLVDGEKRASNIDRMNQALGNYGKLIFAVADTTTQGDSATAQVTITSPHGTAPAMPMTWNHVDGVWKLSDASGCMMLGLAQAPCVPA
jgi:expansin (peptidoglycan-binding protein)